MVPIETTQRQRPARPEDRGGGAAQGSGYLVIAIVALVTGMMIGNIGLNRGGSRIDWPRQVAHPRSIGP